MTSLDSIQLTSLELFKSVRLLIAACDRFDEQAFLNGRRSINRCEVLRRVELHAICIQRSGTGSHVTPHAAYVITLEDTGKV